MEKTEILLTVRDVAEQLKVSELTVRRIEAAGGLVAIQVKGQLRFEPSEVRRFINENKKEYKVNN